MDSKTSHDMALLQLAKLRGDAETHLLTAESGVNDLLTETDPRVLVHELHVQKIELEMQNEELTRAQATAQAALEKYFDLFDFAPVGYFLWDEYGHIVEVNLAGAALLGLDHSTALRMRFAQFVAEEHRVAFADFLKRTLASDSKQRCEVQLQSNGPSWVLIETTVDRDRPDSQKSCRAAVIDITQQKRADEFAAANQLLQTEIAARKQAEQALATAKAAAEVANAAKSRFLAHMSHELRTPMSAILGMIDMALSKPLDPAVKECLQTASGSADLLLTLLNDFLDTAKIESDKLELESAPFSLRQVLNQVTQFLALRASEKGLLFSCHVPECTPDALLGDKTRLQQVLLNLAGNAVKFTERGEVEIGVRALSRDGEAHLEFSVLDTGIGIAASSIEHLFQPFAQADASMARRFGGTGLGLAISKSLVEMMRGRIWVESYVGEGSIFHFTVRLPLAKEMSRCVAAPAAASAAPTRLLRILLAEDNPAHQRLATYFLRGRRHLVNIAGSGEEAVSLSAQTPYDLILMDVQMPGMDGLEATKLIRARETGGRVPIIAMTANALKEDRERCLTGGMDGYLSKPINSQEMIGLIERLAEGPASAWPPVEVSPSTTEISSQRTAVVFDEEQALGICGSNEVLREMIKHFLGNIDSQLLRLRTALEKGDFVEVGRLTHRIKGTLVYLGAESAVEAVLRVERFGASSSEAFEAEEAINVLCRECLALKAALGC